MLFQYLKYKCIYARLSFNNLKVCCRQNGYNGRKRTIKKEKKRQGLSEQIYNKKKLKDMNNQKNSNERRKRKTKRKEKLKLLSKSYSYKPLFL